MPQDNPRSDSPRSETSRGERSRGEKPSVTSMMNAPFGDMGARSVTAGLRAHQKMLDVVSDLGHEWLTRATSEAEWAFKLPNKLTAARSVPDAFSAYQEWFGEGMNMFGEDSRRFISDSQKIIDAGVRCLADATPAATN